MRPLPAALCAGLLSLAGCSAGEQPLIAGGPTPTEAIDAMLDNIRILDLDQAINEDHVRLDATDCARHPNGVVTCRVRLYSLGRGWSAPSVGRFTKTQDTWSFDF